MRNYLPFLLLVTACASEAPPARETARVPLVAEARGVRLADVRVVPPAPGECVGRVEATVENHTGDAMRVVGWRLIDPPEQAPGSRAFDSFSPAVDEIGVAPGGKCVVSALVLRRPGAQVPSSALFQVLAFAPDRREVGAPVGVDVRGWPTPQPLTPEALDRAIADGHPLVVRFQGADPPRRDAFELALDGTRGSATILRGRFQFGTIAPRELTEPQRRELGEALRRAPYARFPARVQGETTADPVRLLVAVGPYAFVGDSEVSDFEDAGLDPLLEHLRDTAHAVASGD